MGSGSLPSTLPRRVTLRDDHDWSADMAAWWARRPVEPFDLPSPAAYRERLATVRRLAVAGRVSPDAVATARWLLQDAERRAGEAHDARERWKREGERLRARITAEGRPDNRQPTLEQRRRLRREARARARARLEAVAAGRVRWAWRCAIAWVELGRAPGGRAPEGVRGRRASYADRARGRGREGWGEGVG